MFDQEKQGMRIAYGNFERRGVQRYPPKLDIFRPGCFLIRVTDFPNIDALGS